MIAKRRRARDRRVVQSAEISELTRDIQRETAFERDLARTVQQDGKTMAMIYEPYLEEWSESFLHPEIRCWIDGSIYRGTSHE
jgi:hypothetical protein